MAHSVLDPVHVSIGSGVHPGISLEAARHLTASALAQAHDARAHIPIRAMIEVHQRTATVARTRVPVPVAARAQLARTQVQVEGLKQGSASGLIDHRYLRVQLDRAVYDAETGLDCA